MLIQLEFIEKDPDDGIAYPFVDIHVDMQLAATVQARLSLLKLGAGGRHYQTLFRCNNK